MQVPCLIFFLILTYHAELAPQRIHTNALHLHLRLNLRHTILLSSGVWRGKWHIAQGNKNSQGKYNTTKHEVSKECIGLESKKKGDSDFDIDRPPNIAEKYSISCLFILAVP